VSFVAINLCVGSQRVFIVVSVYFVIDSVRKLSDTPSYVCVCVCVCMYYVCMYVCMYVCVVLCCGVLCSSGLVMVPSPVKSPTNMSKWIRSYRS
jgi:hypothetical protein